MSGKGSPPISGAGPAPTTVSSLPSIRGAASAIDKKKIEEYRNSLVDLAKEIVRGTGEAKTEADANTILGAPVAKKYDELIKKYDPDDVYRILGHVVELSQINKRLRTYALNHAESTMSIPGFLECKLFHDNPVEFEEKFMEAAKALNYAMSNCRDGTYLALYEGMMIAKTLDVGRWQLWHLNDYEQACRKSQEHGSFVFYAAIKALEGFGESATDYTGLIEIALRSPNASQRIFNGETAEAKEWFITAKKEEGLAAVTGEQIRPMLHVLASTLLAGGSVNIRVKGDGFSTDGPHIYVPTVFSRFPTHEDNAAAYSNGIFHETGHILYDTFKLRLRDVGLSGLGYRVRPGEHKEGDAYVVEKIGAVKGAKPKEVAPLKPGEVRSLSELKPAPDEFEARTSTDLLQCFKNPMLAKHIFNIVEDRRVDKTVIKKRPGLASDYEIESQRLLQMRPIPQEAGRSSDFVEAFLQLVLGDRMREVSGACVSGPEVKVNNEHIRKLEQLKERDDADKTGVERSKVLSESRGPAIKLLKALVKKSVKLIDGSEYPDADGKKKLDELLRWHVSIYLDDLDEQRKYKKKGEEIPSRGEALTTKISDGWFDLYLRQQAEEHDAIKEIKTILADKTKVIDIFVEGEEGVRRRGNRCVLGEATFSNIPGRNYNLTDATRRLTAKVEEIADDAITNNPELKKHKSQELKSAVFEQIARRFIKECHDARISERTKEVEKKVRPVADIAMAVSPDEKDATESFNATIKIYKEIVKLYPEVDDPKVKLTMPSNWRPYEKHDEKAQAQQFDEIDISCNVNEDDEGSGSSFDIPVDAPGQKGGKSKPGKGDKDKKDGSGEQGDKDGEDKGGSGKKGDKEKKEGGGSKGSKSGKDKDKDGEDGGEGNKDGEEGEGEEEGDGKWERFVDANREVDGAEGEELSDEEKRKLEHDEWNYNANDGLGDYIRFHTSVKEKRVGKGPKIHVDQGLVGAVQNVFLALKPKDEITLYQQRYGDGIDHNDLLDYVIRTDVLGEENVPPEYRTDTIYNQRSVAVAILVDCSGSTGFGGRGNKSILSIEKEALEVLAAAIDTIGDTYAVYAYNSDNDANCRDKNYFYIGKDFDDRYQTPNFRSNHANRDGVFIRHIIDKLKERPERTKIMVIISDGQPNDDGTTYRDKYAAQDTRKAVEEAITENIAVFCISVRGEGSDDSDLPVMYGEGRVFKISDVAELPNKITGIYQEITQA